MRIQQHSATNSTLSEHDRKKKKTQQLTWRMWYGSSLFVEDLALGCQIHSKRLLHGHIFCVVKLLFQLEIFMAVAEERRSPPELRHANKLVSKSIFFQPFALNTSPTTFLRKATNETYRFEMFRSWNSMNMNLADACGPQLESLSVWAVISIDTAIIILEVGRLNLFLLRSKHSYAPSFLPPNERNGAISAESFR